MDYEKRLPLLWMSVAQTRGTQRVLRRFSLMTIARIHCLKLIAFAKAYWLALVILEVRRCAGCSQGLAVWRWCCYNKMVENRCYKCYNNRWGRVRHHGSLSFQPETSHFHSSEALEGAAYKDSHHLRNLLFWNTVRNQQVSSAKGAFQNSHNGSMSRRLWRL